MQRIVIIEDDKKIVSVIRSSLGREDFEIKIAPDGIKGLNMVREMLPELIILDLMLPGLDGFEVLEEIRKDSRISNIPVIILTARQEDTDMILGLQLGVDAYMTKPFSPRELIAGVKAVLRKRNAEKGA